MAPFAGRSLKSADGAVDLSVRGALWEKGAPYMDRVLASMTDVVVMLLHDASALEPIALGDGALWLEVNRVAHSLQNATRFGPRL